MFITRSFLHNSFRKSEYSMLLTTLAIATKRIQVWARTESRHLLGCVVKGNIEGFSNIQYASRI